MDAVIFDFGGVLTTSPTSLMAARAAEFGHDLRDVMPLMLGPFDRSTDHPWHRIERGEISFDEMVEAMVDVFADAGIDRPMSPPPPERMVAAMLEWRDVVGADDLVDVVVDSCEVGLRKPDDAIYRLTMERLGVDDPSRCVFLDDFVWNIAPAQRLRMPTIHVTDAVEAAAELRAFLDL